MYEEEYIDVNMLQVQDDIEEENEKKEENDYLYILSKFLKESTRLYFIGHCLSA